LSCAAPRTDSRKRIARRRAEVVGFMTESCRPADVAASRLVMILMRPFALARADAGADVESMPAIQAPGGLTLSRDSPTLSGSLKSLPRRQTYA
jgi:hypothetical protein